MVDGVKDGTAARGVTTYMEEESRRYFESGKATYMRNWPYAYALGEKAQRRVKGKFDVMPFPEFEGGGKAGILGGHNFVISVYSDNPGGALAWTDYMTQEEQQVTEFVDFSLAPTLASVYEKPEVQKKYEFAPQLRGRGRAGEGPSGLAGLPADLAGDLRERQRGARRAGDARGGAEEGADRHAGRVGDLLISNG